MNPGNPSWFSAISSPSFHLKASYFELPINPDFLKLNYISYALSCIICVWKNSSNSKIRYCFIHRAGQMVDASWLVGFYSWRDGLILESIAKVREVFLGVKTGLELVTWHWQMSTWKEREGGRKSRYNIASKSLWIPKVTTVPHLPFLLWEKVHSVRHH
jgi:hypothetical protein